MCTRRSDSRERLLEQRQVNRHEHHARAGAGANTCCCTTSPAVAWAAAAARLACSPLCPPSAAAEARIKRRFHHTSHITHHTSHITHHTSHVTRHTSHVTRHLQEHPVKPRHHRLQPCNRRRRRRQPLVLRRCPGRRHVDNTRKPRQLQRILVPRGGGGACVIGGCRHDAHAQAGVQRLQLVTPLAQRLCSTLQVPLQLLQLLHTMLAGVVPLDDGVCPGAAERAL